MKVDIGFKATISTGSFETITPEFVLRDVEIDPDNYDAEFAKHEALALKCYTESFTKQLNLIPAMRRKVEAMNNGDNSSSTGSSVR